MTETIPSFALNVVTLGVSDFTRSVRFYEALGFKRRMRATGDEVAFFDAGSTILALYRAPAFIELPFAKEAQLPSYARRDTMFHAAVELRITRDATLELGPTASATPLR